jgi:tetratricopeptide (TPR) repeat protein
VGLLETGLRGGEREQLEKLRQISRVADAFYVLKAEAIKALSAEDEARFTAWLAAYREKAATSSLPEEIRRFQVQAEGAVLDKKFDDAADLYDKALKVAPWWPAGHFNFAVVLAEIGDYEMAIREMKRYLLLAPNAPNARAVQDNIYGWERKTRDSN